MEIQHEATTYYCLIKYQEKLLMWANKKSVQSTFDSWKCQLLCNKMSKVENSYKLRLKTILKQHNFNVNMAQMNKNWCMQILISVHMDRFAYIQNLLICKLKFALGLNQVQISRICIWCKFCICVQIHSHGQICTREYICIYANLSMWKLQVLSPSGLTADKGPSFSLHSNYTGVGMFSI